MTSDLENSISSDVSSTQVVIIAGGRAKRMGLDIPKCLLEIGGKTLLQICLDSIVRQGFTDIVILLGHGHKQVSSHVNGLDVKQRITYSVDPETPLGWGKGKAFKHALLNGTISRAKRSIIVFPDDIVLDDFIHTKLLSFHKNTAAINGVTASLVVVPRVQVPYGIAHVRMDGLVTNFEEKPMVELAASVGVYLFEPQVYSLIDQSIDLSDPLPTDLESTIIPSLVNEHKVSALFTDSENWLPVNTIKEFEFAKKILSDRQ